MWNSTFSKKPITELTLRCKYCRRSTKVKQQSYGLSVRKYGPFYHPKVATNITIRMNGLKIKGELYDGK